MCDVPAINAPMSRDISFLPFRVSGTSPLMILCASPSAIAVLPTPGSPVKCQRRHWFVRLKLHDINRFLPVEGDDEVVT